MNIVMLSVRDACASGLRQPLPEILHGQKSLAGLETDDVCIRMSR